MNDQQSFPPLVKRFQSLFIDQLFIIACMVMFSMLLGNTAGNDALRGALLFSLFLVYEPFCMAFGCSAGNYLTGIRVRRYHDNSKRINIFNSYLRFFVKIMLGIISFFTVTSDHSKRAIHDKAAGSLMVYRKNLQRPA